LIAGQAAAAAAVDREVGKMTSRWTDDVSDAEVM